MPFVARWLALVLAFIALPLCGGALALETSQVSVQAPCFDVDGMDKEASWNLFAPAAHAFRELGYELTIEGNEFAAEAQKRLDRTSVGVAVPPHHGRFVRVATPREYHYWRYEAEDGYLGEDSAVFFVELDGRTVRVSVNVNVMDVVPESNCEMEQCPPKDPPACWSVFPTDPTR